MNKFKSIDELRNAASDGHVYTNDSIKNMLIDELRRKAHRRGLKSGLIVGIIIGCFLTWVML
jgi:hypothetical protein